MGATWAEKPFPLIETPRVEAKGEKESVASEHATNMALVHNLLIRGLNAIYLQAPFVKEQEDIQDFITFMAAWSKFLHYHHKTEEEIGFPFLDSQTGVVGLMDGNRRQHEAFESGLELYDAHLRNLEQNKTQYNGQHIINLIDGFGVTLTTHLKDEIGTLKALDKYEDKIDWPLYDKVVHRHAYKNASKTFIVPFAMTNFDMTFEGGIHIKNWPFTALATLALRYIFVPKNAGAWRFSTCDSYGQPKPSAFL